MKQNSKIYVAGHRGLVGSAILRKLKEDGYTNLVHRTRQELDLTRQQEVEEFFDQEKPDYVFLAAAKVGGILANNTYPADFIYNNLAVQTNVIHASYLYNIKRLLFLGSSCIYPRNCPQPMKEEYLLSGYLEHTNEPYAIAKIAGLKMCQSYNRQHGTRYITVMPTNLYGPGDNFDLKTSHVLPALIRKFHEAKVGSAYLPEANSSNLKGSAPQTSDGDSVTIWGTGKPRREFLYVEDLADASVFLMNLPSEKYFSPLTSNASPLLNIGTGKDCTIRELAEMIARVVGFEGTLQFDATKPDGTPRKLLEVSKLKSLGWRPKVELEEGIKETYNWYIESVVQS